MKNALVPAWLLAAALLVGCDALVAPTEGSGRVATRAVPVAGAFTALEVEGAFRVEVADAPAVAVSAEADDNLLPLLEAEVSEGCLRLTTSGPFTSPNPFVLRIAAPGLSSVTASGAAAMTIASLAGDEVSVTAAGASQVVVATVSGKSLRVRANGTSTVTLTGTTAAETVEIRTSDTSVVAADIDCADLAVNGEGGSKVSGMRTRTATLHLSAGAAVDLDASKRLEVRAIGTAKVCYGGKPEITGRAGVGVSIEPRAK
jgi:hypothetical protein